MKIDELRSLREQILADVTPLVAENTAGGPDGFALLLRLIQSGNAADEIYRKAYDSAKSIEDKGERLDALMSLLDEVDVDIDQQTSTEPEVGGSAAESTSSELPQDNAAPSEQY